MVRPPEVAEMPRLPRRDTHDTAATVIDPDEALRQVLQEAMPRPIRAVSLAEACGMQLAEPIIADRDYPPFPRAMMDGYAVAASDAQKTVSILGEVAAGQESAACVAAGHCLRIMTGAPCPPGTEAVVPEESVCVEGRCVTLPAHIVSGQHIARLGCECRRGTTVLRPGQTISPLAVAVIASCGMDSVRVVPRPVPAVITTGTELIPPRIPPMRAQIRDSNGPMLVAMIRDMGLSAPVHLHADDRIGAILSALESCAEADVVLLTGGVSIGRYDLVPEALQDYAARTVFHRVTQKPGKPLLLARKNAQLIFGLPGNPLAVHFCFHRYAAAAIRKMQGKQPVLPSLRGELIEPVGRNPNRTYFVAGIAEQAKDPPNGWRLQPLPGVNSADVFAPCSGNCYLEVVRGPDAAQAGEVVPFTFIGNGPWPN